MAFNLKVLKKQLEDVFHVEENAKEMQVILRITAPDSPPEQEESQPAPSGSISMGDFTNLEKTKELVMQFAGLDGSTPMSFEMDEETKTISMKFEEKKDFKKTSKVMKKLPENLLKMMEKMMKGFMSAFG